MGHCSREDTTIKETDLAYVAGIIDGEGCVQIQKVKPHNREKSEQYKLQLRVYNTDRSLIEYLNQLFPAYTYDGSEKRNNRRKQFCWHANGKKTVIILQQVLPYLVVKKEQALLAIEFYETFNRYYGIFGVPVEVRQLRLRLYQECRRLKKQEYPAFKESENGT